MKSLKVQPCFQMGHQRKAFMQEKLHKCLFSLYFYINILCKIVEIHVFRTVWLVFETTDFGLLLDGVAVVLFNI